MTKQQLKKRPRSPSTVRVSPVTEWTDYLGIHELFGVRRTTADSWYKAGKVESVSSKRPGEKRGKRLFYVPSFRRFLESQLRAEEAK